MSMQLDPHGEDFENPSMYLNSENNLAMDIFIWILDHPLSTERMSASDFAALTNVANQVGDGMGERVHDSEAQNDDGERVDDDDYPMGELVDDDSDDEQDDLCLHPLKTPIGLSVSLSV